ncbi:hypothetical protein FRB97_008834 [Tulasnella sp. 331]|nr:hypothetical protein FRB97_008834 [Tulasnella sp. 331]
MSLDDVGRRGPLLEELKIRDASGVSENIIDGMASIRSLTSVDMLGVMGSSQLDVANINLIVAHHPHLEALILKPNIRPELTGGVAVNGLLGLTQHCKALEYMDFPLDLSYLARKSSDIDLQALADTPSLTVTKVAVWIVIGRTNTERPAQFLARLLPNVADLSLSDVLRASEQEEEPTCPGVPSVPSVTTFSGRRSNLATG